MFSVDFGKMKSTDFRYLSRKFKRQTQAEQRKQFISHYHGLANTERHRKVNVNLLFLSLELEFSISVGCKPMKLDANEQSKLAKTGLELKLLTSEIDAEVERWQDHDNEILKRAKNMSSMAFSMYLFTRGEGTLRTTQDLFTQAFYFVEEGTRLSSIIQQLSTQIQSNDLTIQLEQISLMCHQLKFKLKATALGKTPTFTKVDTVVCQIRDFLSIIIRLCSIMFDLRSKVN